jgi:hypothetical protein
VPRAAGLADEAHVRRAVPRDHPEKARRRGTSRCSSCRPPRTCTAPASLPGVVGVLRKPFEIDELLDRVRTHCDAARPRAVPA